VDGRVLSQTVLNQFEAGRYYKWSVQGSVRFQFQSRSGALLLCGVFVDPLHVRAPSVSIFSPQSGATVNAPSRLSTRLLFADPDNLIERTEFYVDNQLFTEFPYRADYTDLPRVLYGSHWLSAAIVDRYGVRRWSAPILLNGQPPQP